MSNPTTLASRSVPFALSDDDVTYKNVVCKKLWNLNVENTITQEDSDCDTHTAVGSTRVSFDFEFILNLTPNGATEISADTVIGYAVNKTFVYAKVAYSTSYYRQIGGYISNLREQAPQGGLITVTGTFTGSGTLDITA